MGKLGFNRGNAGIEKSVCAETSGMTKKQRIKDFESGIRHNSERLKTHNKEMEALAFLRGGYTYNSEYLTLMIGQCFIEINEAKSRKKELKKMVKQLKASKEK